MNGLVWFKNDLRTLDNQSLSLATELCTKVIGVYCLDPKLFQNNKYGFKKIDKFRAKFLIESLQELKYNLSKYNIPLFVYLGLPEQHIQRHL